MVASVRGVTGEAVCCFADGTVSKGRANERLLAAFPFSAPPHSAHHRPKTLPLVVQDSTKNGVGLEIPPALADTLAVFGLIPGSAVRAGSGHHIGCQGLIPCCLRARQVPYCSVYRSSLLSLILLKHQRMFTLLLCLSPRP